MSGELCPFCKSEINLGATVCSACGAYKMRRRGLKSVQFLVLLGAFGFGCYILFFLEDFAYLLSNWQVNIMSVSFWSFMIPVIVCIFLLRRYLKGYTKSWYRNY